MDDTTTTTETTVDHFGFICHEDEVLTDDGACHNFEEVPVELTVVSDWCSVQGLGFCEGTVDLTEAVVIERPAAPAQELARTGTEANFALLGLSLLFAGRFFVGLANRRNRW
jgi:hypothetical protein